MTMFVVYVRDVGEFSVPVVEMGGSLADAVGIAIDHVPDKKRDAAKKSLSSKRKWKDEETGLEIEIKGKDN